MRIVDIARKYRVPVTPYSGATSLEGHFSGVGIHYYHWARVYKFIFFSIQPVAFALICPVWTKFWRLMVGRFSITVRGNN